MSQFVTLALSVGIVYLNLFMDVPIQDQTSYSRYRISEQQTRILGPIGLRFSPVSSVMSIRPQTTVSRHTDVNETVRWAYTTSQHVFTLMYFG